jgi:pyrophosphatase PpaX
VKSLYKEIQGYIFDIDGTLLDSTPTHLNAWKRALAEADIVRSDNEILSLFGKPTKVIAEILLVNAGLEASLSNEIANNKTRYFVESIPTIPLFEGVQDILSLLHENGYKICFASANYNFIIEKMMDVFDWNKISVGYIGVDDVKHSKPDPEMLNLAMNKMGTRPEDSVIIGDSEYDILAGKAAKTMTVAVCTKHEPLLFQRLQSDIIIQEIGDLMEYLPLKQTLQ